MEIMSLWFSGDTVFIFAMLLCVPLQQVFSTINKKTKNSLLLNDFMWQGETANIIVSIHLNSNIFLHSFMIMILVRMHIFLCTLGKLHAYKYIYKLQAFNELLVKYMVQVTSLRMPLHLYYKRWNILLSWLN